MGNLKKAFEEIERKMNNKDKVACTCGAVWSFDGIYACGPIVGKVEDFPDVSVALNADCPCCWSN